MFDLPSILEYMIGNAIIQLDLIEIRYEML